jgi:hypothetical protein
MYVTETEWQVTDWTDVALDGEKWHAFVNIVMNMRGIP